MEEEDAKSQGYHNNNSRPKQERGSRVDIGNKPTERTDIGYEEYP